MDKVNQNATLSQTKGPKFGRQVRLVSVVLVVATCLCSVFAFAQQKQATRKSGTSTTSHVTIKGNKLKALITAWSSISSIATKAQQDPANYAVEITATSKNIRVLVSPLHGSTDRGDGETKLAVADTLIITDISGSNILKIGRFQ